MAKGDDRQMDVSDDILRGVDEIMAFMRISSRASMRKLFISKSFPAFNLFGCYYAHKDNLRDWARRNLRSDGKPFDEKAE